jgi:hypothetical protein
MKKSVPNLRCAVLLVGVAVLTSYSQEFRRTGQSTMTFLSIDPVARSAGMGGASTSMDGDVNALFHNPAGMARMVGGAISLNNTQWLADTKQYSVAAGYAFEGVGTFGLSMMMMDNGDIPRTIPDGSRQGFHQDGTFRVTQLALGLGYARQITDKFSIGGHVKYAYQDLGPTDITWQVGSQQYDTLRNVKNDRGVVAIDFGTVYYPGFKDFRVAMTFRNFSTKVRYAYDDSQLPVVLRMGVAMNVLGMVPGAEGHSLQVSVEVAHPNDYSDRVYFGGEYSFQDLFHVRGGYQLNVDEGELSAGLGISQSVMDINLKLDYAYTRYGEAFGAVHRLSVGFCF